MNVHVGIPLPQELIELIIDFAHDDPRTLRSCALVCRAWLPSSRYHLFSSIIVRLRKTSEITQIKNDLLRFDTGPSELSILNYARRLVFTIFLDVAGEFMATEISLIHCLPCLPDLQTLAINRATDLRTIYIDLTGISSIYPNITALHLSDLNFISVSEVYHVVSQFLTLEDITFCHCQVHNDADTDFASFTPPSTRLKSVSMYPTSNEFLQFLDWTISGSLDA